VTTPREAMTDASPPVIAKALGAGAVIAGRYRLEARLGTGGGGTVWRCLDLQLDAIVALKIVSADGDLERWRREVAMARRIANRNVCRVHDLGVAGELRYVTMELVEGDSLRGRIAADSPAAAARDLFTQIVGGVSAIHAAGVVHRDLKPENIVVARDGRAVIVDFGLAREPRGASATTRTGPAVTDPGVVVGTPRYMSPEQAAGLHVDVRTDVWALGLIGHELMTGALPPPDAHGRRIDPAVDAKWPGLGAVLRRCVALLPEERFADARDIEHAIASLRRGRATARNAIAAVAIAATIAVAGVIAFNAKQDEAAPKSPVVPVVPVAPVAPVAAPPGAPSRMTQLTVTEPKKWPDDAPISVALSPDASQFAYTTANPRLLVRPTAGGAAVAWSLPALEKVRTRTSDTPESTFVRLWVVGWFGDGSLALIGSDRDGGHQLHRAFADGRNQLLYRYAQRFTAAATPAGDRVAIAVDDHAMFVVTSTEGSAPVQIAALQPGEQVLAMAWSPDGARLAYAALPGDPSADAAIRVLPATGGESREVWRGPLSAIAGQLLAWLDENRLAFAGNDLATGRARLFTVDTRGRPAEQRDDWAETYVGPGSAARGTLVMLRGAATRAVQIGDRSGWGLVRLHDRGVRAQRLAGWTADQRAVFTVGAPGKEQIVRAAPGQAFESWPGTRAGVELPDTLAGDDLIAHRIDQAAQQIVVERIAPDGTHTELARVSAHAADCDVVRCAGDRAAPCVIADSDGRVVRWAEIDPATGARGAQIHQRPLRERSVCSAALSADGVRLAIADGGETIALIDRTTGKDETRSGGEGCAMQSVGFAADGDVWASATGFRGRPSGMMAFSRLDSGAIGSSPSSRGNPRADALRFYARPSPSPDGKQLAVATLDLELEVWRADGL